MVAANASICLQAMMEFLARKVAPQHQTSADLLHGLQQESCILGYAVH
jgi:hypothetical protein